MTAYMFSLSRLPGPFFPQNGDLLREKTALFPPEGLCHGVSAPASLSLRRLHPWSWVEPLGKHLRTALTLKDWKRQRIFTWKNTSRGRRQLQIETQVSNRPTEKHTAHCVSLYLDTWRGSHACSRPSLGPNRRRLRPALDRKSVV